MSKRKKKNNTSRTQKPKEPITLSVDADAGFSAEEWQHIIANAMVEAEEIKDAKIEKQKDQELLEWQQSVGYKEYTSKCKIIRAVRNFLNRLKCFVVLCFIPEKKVKGDRASFLLTKAFLRMILNFAHILLLLMSVSFVFVGISGFFSSGQWLSNILLVVFGITVFAFARFFRMASIEVDKNADRNYIFGLFATVASIVSIVIAIIAIVKGA